MEQRDYLQHTFAHPHFIISDDSVGSKALDAFRKSLDLNKLQPGQVHVSDLKSDGVRPDARKCKSLFLPPEGTIFEKMKSFAMECNDQYWKFSPPFQFAKPQLAFYGPGDFFDWHADANYMAPHRRLAVILLLSDTNDFTGGKFEIKNWLGKSSVAPLTKGKMLVFPACFYHRVTPIKSGSRQTLTLLIF